MNRRHPRWPLALLAALFAAATGARTLAARGALTLRLPAMDVEYPIEYLRMAALSFRPLAADLLWIGFIQDLPLSPSDPATGRKLGRELTTVIALDPAFRSAYVHGPVMLSVLGNQHCTALDVSQRGIPRFPDDWRLPFNAGYFCFAEIGDFGCAARNMKQAASIPGSPRWLPGLVARLMAHSDQREAAIEYLQQRLADPALTDPTIRGRLEDRLHDATFSLWAERIEVAVRGWRLAHGGALPASIEELAMSPAPPAQDPYGGAWRIATDGSVESSTGNKGLVLFRRESAFTGDPGERWFEYRIGGRLPEYLDEPLFLRDRLDLLTNLHEAAKDLATVEQWEETRDPEAARDLRALEARIMIRDEIDRMKAAQLELLREHPGSLPTLAEIEAKAGVHAEDAFGTAYRLDEHGVPAPGPSRQPLVLLDEPGASPCR